MKDNTSSDDRDFEYWAFISYNRQDLRTARWLKKTLADESIPAGFRNRIKAGESTFTNIFLDETSLPASAAVDVGLQKALRASRNLSKESPQMGNPAIPAFA